MGGPQGRHALGLALDPIGLAIHQIARDHDEIGPEFVGAGHEALHLVYGDQGPQVQVGDLHDAEALQSRG